MTREQIQHEGGRPLPCAAQEAFRCRPDALSDDEKTILSAMVLQKGEAEAAEIFRESPEHLRDYTILKGVNSYAALGRYYLANETTVPEELYEYMDLGALGCRYEDEHPGVFIGSDYVCYPAEEQDLTMEMQIAEGVDSKNGLDNLMLPMTNVINSLYARQASTKTKAAHRARASSGMYMGSHAPFGYQKDPKDRHHLIVDPDAADVVKDIFQMFADGIGYVRMTKILRERKVLNPQAYFNQNNPDYYKNSDYWRKPFDWHATSVRVILNNPVYLGNVVFGRTKTKGFFDKQRIEADESEWIVKENTHEAIITRELWDTVHQMMKARRRENSTGTVQPFAGLVKCADCGSSLNVSYDKKKGRYNGFTCWVYKNYGKERCTSHAIGWVTLNQLVLEDIRRNAYEAKTAAGDYMQMLVDAKTEKQKTEIDRCKRELKKADKRIEELTKILNKLYEDVALEKISEERYQAMAPKYEQEQSELRGQREKLSAEIARNDEIYDNIQQFLPLIWKYTNVQELTPHILNELIEKIVVHEKEIGEGGVKTQQVDIYYKFIGCVNLRRAKADHAEIIKTEQGQADNRTA